MNTDQCPTCAGTPKHHPFAKYCEEHNVCIDCGIKRRLLDHAPWGMIDAAFMCNPCHEKRRKAGIEERKKKGIDSEYTDEIVCPHCGYEHCDSWEYGEGEHECHECYEKFEVEKIVSVQYTTSKKEKENVQKG